MAECQVAESLRVRGDPSAETVLSADIDKEQRRQNEKAPWFCRIVSAISGPSRSCGWFDNTTRHERNADRNQQREAGDESQEKWNLLSLCGQRHQERACYGSRAPAEVEPIQRRTASCRIHFGDEKIRRRNCEPESAAIGRNAKNAQQLRACQQQGDARCHQQESESSSRIETQSGTPGLRKGRPRRSRPNIGR